MVSEENTFSSRRKNKKRNKRRKIAKNNEKYVSKEIKHALQSSESSFSSLLGSR
jgi:hypothetical protein